MVVFPTAACQTCISAIMRAAVSGLERSPGVTGSLCVSAWSCFDIIFYTRAHAASEGPDGAEQL